MEVADAVGRDGLASPAIGETHGESTMANEALQIPEFVAEVEPGDIDRTFDESEWEDEEDDELDEIDEDWGDDDWGDDEEEWD